MSNGQKNRNTKPSDLATANRQKIIGGSKKLAKGSKKSGEQKMVIVKKGVYKSSVGGGKLMPRGGTLPGFATAWYTNIS